MKLFSPDSPFSKAMSLIGDLIILNLCFIVCCLPLITIGSAITALYTVTMAIAENRESNVFSQFFRAFRSNFKQSTLVWMIILCAASILLIFYLLALSANAGFQFALMAILLFLCLIGIAVLVMIFPLMARFQNTIPAMLRNALALGISHPMLTIVLALVSASPFFIIACGEEFFLRCSILWLLIAFSGVTQINSYIIKHIFKKHTTLNS